MSKDIGNPQRGAPGAPSGSQEATVALISAIQSLAIARTTYPESLQAQQAHFASTLPAAEEALRELLCEHLGQEERRALLDVLCEVEGLEAPEYDDDEEL